MPFKTILKILLPVCLLIVSGVLCIIIFLPDISTHIVQSFLGPLPGNQPFDFTVSRLGVNYTQVSDVSLGEDLRLDTVRATYRMDTKNIINVEKVFILGLNAVFHLDEDNRIRISGFSFPREKDQDNSSPAFDITAYKSYFAYLPRHMVLKNSSLFIDTGEQRICIPVQADVRFGPDRRIADLTLSIFPMNQKITLKAGIDLSKGPVQMKLFAHDLYPQLLLAMMPGKDLAPNKFYGPMDFEIESKDFSNFYFKVNGLGGEPDSGLKIDFPQISGVFIYNKTAMVLKAQGALQLISPGINAGVFKFEMSSQIKSGAVDHFALTLQNENNNAWRITPGIMDFSLPTAGIFEQIQLLNPQFNLAVSGNLEHQTGALAVCGTGLELLKNCAANPLKVMDISGLQIKTEFNGNFMKPESLKHLKLDAIIDKVAFQQDNIEMNTASLNASSDAEFTFLNSGIILDTAKARINSCLIRLKQDGTKADIPQFNLEAVLKKGRTGQDSAIKVNAVCNKAKIVTKQATAFVTKAGITGEIKNFASQKTGFQLTPWLSGTNINMKDKGIQAKGVYFELPVTYPFNNKRKYGRAGAKKVILHDGITPAVSANVVQTSNLVFDISGKVTRTGLKGLAIDFSARAGLDSAMHFFAKGQAATNQLSITRNTLSRFIPGISGIDNLECDLSAKADFSCKNQEIQSSADIEFSNGSLKSDESGFSVSGISADMHFNDLMVPETLPGQFISIDKINAGRLNFNNGKIRFSIEDGKSINIENLKFNWCNGIVSTEAFRLPAKDDAIQLTLYCDRLEMEDLFHQLGAFEAEGGGTLSGRIPVVMKNAEVGFNDGFLFSTPGDGGRIFIKGLDKMLVGVPKNTQQFSQLDLAGEALKNFEYKWVKLKLNTHGDTLAVNMQLDGKPVSPLPFEYNQDVNSFIRVNAQSPGSNFQGIKLDVNLSLPFNQVLEFGNNLNSIMNP